MDLKKQHDIESILSEYISGELPEELERDIRLWYCANSEGRESVEALRNIFIRAAGNDISDDKAAEMYRKFCEIEKALSGETSRQTAVTKVPLRKRVVFRIAAIMVSAAVLSGVGTLLFNNKASGPEQPYIERSIVVAADNLRYLILPDGSEAWINSDGELAYADDFGNVRMVWLKGEAYFAVIKDTEHPFTVVTDRVKVEVLGTEFNVRDAGEGSLVEVVLASGSVGVETAKAGRILMHPGQLLTYYDGEALLTECDAEEYAEWRWKSFDFYNTPIHEALKIISEYFGLALHIDDAVDPAIRISLNAIRPSLEEIMESLVSITGGFEYSVTDNHLYITPKP